MGYFIKRGTTYGPWIPIYGFGALFITIVGYKFRNKPLLVFLISSLVSGLLEFVTGYLLFHVSNIRLWDYNNEILNSKIDEYKNDNNLKNKKIKPRASWW